LNNPILPDWTRHAYVSAAAREWYAPLFADYISAFHTLERLAVVEGIRQAAWQFISPAELVEQTAWAHEHGLLLIPAENSFTGQSYSSGAPPAGTGTASYRCVLVKPHLYEHILPFRDNQKIGRYLGYPQCCRNAFDVTWGSGWVDTTLAQWELTDWTKPTLASTLWRFMGVRFVPHLPCSWSCVESNNLASQFIDLANKYGYGEQVRFAKELFAMPVKWSQVFGVAELVSPIVKVSTRSNWTPTMECAEKPGSHAEVTDALWLDNGFKTAAGMREAHGPLLQALTVGVPQNARVVDLGCGNGLLMRRLKQERHDVKIAGVDTNADAIAHIPPLSGTWWNGTIQSIVWQGWTPDVALINPVRLVEMPPEDAVELRERLLRLPLVIVYVYSDHINELESLVEQAGLGPVEMLTKTPAVTVGLLKGNSHV